MARFSNGKAPYLRVADTKNDTSRIMLDFVIALLPCILFAIIKNGIIPFAKGYVSFFYALYPLLFILVGGLSSMLFEAAALSIMYEDARTFKGLLKRMSTSYSLIPGLILALILPLHTPMWILVLGVFFATIVGKMIFGGFGQNIFNPALVGYIFVVMAFGAVINDKYFNAAESYDLVAAATPLANLSSSPLDYNSVVAPYGNLFNFFLGTIPGAMGETSVLCCLLGYAYLVWRKVINFRVPVIYVGTVFAITLIIGLVNGTGLWYPLFNIMSGGLMFGAVFMATEPVTTPKNVLGKTMFAVTLGALTVLFRLVGSMPEGVCTAILTMNVFGLLIDRYSAKIRAVGINKKNVSGLIIYSAITLAIIVYSIIMVSISYGGA